jgi:hypothetical protein
MKKAKKEKTAKASTWYGQIFDSLDFAEVAKTDDLNPETEPQWVVNAFREVSQQMMPAFSFRDATPITPKGLGQYLGQQRANIAAIAALFEQASSPENLARTKAFWESLEKNKENPAIKAIVEGPVMASLETAGEFLMSALESGERVDELFNKAAIKALKTAWQQPNQSETVSFFQGLAQGLSNPGIRKNSAARSTTATPIYQRLIIHRREIEKLKSVRELYEFLLQRGVSKQVLGDPRRLEKLCGRVGFHPGRDGKKRAK